MSNYSPFFQTIYDQEEPVGFLGRGAHYSILRAMVFHDGNGTPTKAMYHDFAVLWDEDHDTRITEVICRIYAAGLLSAFTFFGERKGMLFAIACEPKQLSNSKKLKIDALCKDINGDSWDLRLGTQEQPEGIINDKEEKVLLFLNNINMLWKLGCKEISPSSEIS